MLGKFSTSEQLPPPQTHEIFYAKSPGSNMHKEAKKMGMLVHVYNPTYLGGPAWVKKVARPCVLSQKQIQTKGLEARLKWKNTCLGLHKLWTHP
jgi:hypothetical protein